MTCALAKSSGLARSCLLASAVDRQAQPVRGPHGHVLWPHGQLEQPSYQAAQKVC